MIDLRSDTVTRPSRAMLEAMMAARLGTTLWNDPTVNALQDYAAEFSGKEAAIFCLPALRPTRSLCSVTANAAKSISSVRPRITICLKPVAQQYWAVFSRNPSTQLPTVRYRWIKWR